MYHIIYDLDLDRSSFVKSLNESKILKKRQNKNESIISKKSLASNIFDKYSMDEINNKLPDINKNLDSGENQHDLKLNKDISGITQKDNYYMKESINNSIFLFDNMTSENFNHDDDNIEKLQNFKFEKKLSEEDQDKAEKKRKNLAAKILGDYYFNKIVNAQLNEEIILPAEPISMKYLRITKPLKLIGQPNCQLEITEGPIIIKINEKYENEVVKFSQVKIQFDINLTDMSISEDENTNSKFSFLFKIYPGSIVEIEDCDITCVRENATLKNKFICFLIKYCQFPEVSSETTYPNITILTIISTRIEKFYQTIRAGENCIINIEKSFINKNIGKPIAVLNPLIMKIVGTVFENNGDNAIHVKFVKDDNLINDSRKLFFNNNEFLYNNGCGIFIDGLENFVFDLDITIDSNLFKRNAGDGIFFMDILAKSFLIQKNQFICGKMNGLNLQKVYQKVPQDQKDQVNIIKPLSIISVLSPTPNIEIKENEFIENDGYGIFLSDTKAKISVNNFIHNGMGGILLVNLTISYNGNSNSGNSNLGNYNSNVIDINSGSKSGHTHGNTSSLVNAHNSISSHVYTSPGTTTLFKNSLFKNGGSGVKIVNYNNFVSVSECIMKENIEFGIYIEFDFNPSILNVNNKNINTENNSTIMDKIKSFQSSDNSKIPKETNIFLHNSSLINNMKSGLFLNNCFAFLENTIINDNLDFSVYVPKQQFAKCYKLSKNSNSNLINGNVGGPWGEISISSRTLCSTCTSTTKIKRNKIHTETNSEQIVPELKKNIQVDNPNEIVKAQYNTEDPNKNNIKNMVINDNKNSNDIKANSNDPIVNKKQNSDENEINKCRIM